MPKLLLAVPETHESILRPVVFEVARELLKITGLPKDTPISFPDAVGTVVMPGSQLDPSGENSKFTSSNKLLIEVTEDFLDDHVLTTSVINSDNQLIFEDKALGVTMKPVYTKTNVTLAVTFRCTSKNIANSFISQMRTRTSMGRRENLHEAAYHYPIPAEYLVILNAIHGLREKQGGYGEDLKKYFTDSFTGKLTSITNVAGGSPTLAIAESQIGILGWFDFSAQPEQPTRDEPGIWSITFSYIFAFDKVTEMYFKYPMQIHNTLLPTSLRGRDLPVPLESRYQAPGYVVNVMNMFASRDPRLHVGLDGVSQPEWDDWLPNYTQAGTNTLIRIMLAVNPLDLREIADLKNIGKYAFSANILRYMASEAAWLGVVNEAAIFVSLYSKADAWPSGSFITSPTLTLTAKKDLSIREGYHLRVGLVTNLSGLSERAKEALRADPPAFFDIIITLNPEWKDKLPPLIGLGVLPKKDFDSILDQLRDSLVGYPSRSNLGLEQRFLSVNTSRIIAVKE